MPILSEVPEIRKDPAKVLIYGPSGTKKTLWAHRPSEHGYDVISINGERNYGILRILSPEAQKRVFLLNAFDEPDTSIFAPVVGELVKSSHIVWDDTAGKKAGIPPSPKHDHLVLRLNELTTNTVLVFETITALVASVTLNLQKKLGIDPTEGEKASDTRGYYGGQNIILDRVLQFLTNLPCHVIVVAHSVLVEQKRKDLSDPKKDIITGYRTQPISSSVPHAQKIAKLFQEVYYFNMLGTAYNIDTTTTSERDGCSRIFPPNNYPFEKLQFIDLIKTSKNLALPNPSIVDRGIQFIKAGEDMTGAFRANSTPAPVLDATKNDAPKPAVQASGGAMAMLMGGKK